ncbi:integrase core domain-containing protein [Microbacterium sp. NPDC057650]|uniref:integrase core domain-containing protein n=1 Tax=unclassified Microbacterium TaxID=2609290 RepID=UPI0036733BAA
MKSKNLVIVRAVHEQGLTRAEAAARYGVTRQWVHTLVTRYENEGPDGVAPRSRAPKTRPGTTGPVIRDRIIQLRRELTSSGADAGPITIAWFLADGTRVEILDFLDDHARYLLDIRPAAAFTGPMVVTVMTELIDRYGPPASTLTDNGLVFTARLARYKGARGGFEKLLAAHRILQKNGRPGHPQTQGKIERFHQTLKRWLKARPLPNTIKALADLLTEFQTWYNTARPHRSLGHRTPEQAYTALPKAAPTGTTDTTEWRSRTDIVDKNGKVTLRYAGQIRHLGIGRAHTGTPVLMLIHDRNVTISSMNTSEIIAEFTIDPTRDYQHKKP